MDTLSSPDALAKLGFQWAHQSPITCLAFFTSELDSHDPKHVKAGILCIAVLSHMIDYTGPGEVSPEVKSSLDKNFPLEKFKNILAVHPEYAEWASLLGSTERGRTFPQLQSPSP